MAAESEIATQTTNQSICIEKVKLINVIQRSLK